jgi:hypothetical protein
METLNKAKDAATKAIWGDKAQDSSDHGSEPLSGQQGRGTVEEPYDSGNRDGKS